MTWSILSAQYCTDELSLHGKLREPVGPDIAQRDFKHNCMLWNTHYYEEGQIKD